MAVGAAHVALCDLSQQNLHVLATTIRRVTNLEFLLLGVAVIELQNDRIVFAAADAGMRFLPLPDEGADTSPIVGVPLFEVRPSLNRINVCQRILLQG